MKMILKVGLIKGRHEMPVDRYLIDSQEVDFSRAHIIAREAMSRLIQQTGVDDEIHLYISGLTRATLGALAAWLQTDSLGSDVTSPEPKSFRKLRIVEWNADTGKYESVMEFVHRQYFCESADLTYCTVVPML